MIWFWLGFFALVALLLFLDLGVVHRRAQEQTLRSAAMWTLAWVALGLSFSGVVYLMYANNWLGVHPHGDGADASVTYVAAYLLEQALSIDNIFVMSLLFRSFKMPLKYQHRVLFWGILGAVIFRVTMLAGGAYLAHKFDFIFYVFGAYLAYQGGKLFWEALKEEEEDDDEEESTSKNRAVRMLRRFLPIKEGDFGGKFTVRVDGKKFFTTVFVCLIVIELTDVVFALDSIPAVLSVSNDTFIMVTSNIFAILGLRSLYFVLAGAMNKFHYLKYALAVLLVFIGVKMFAHSWLHIEDWLSLVIIAGILASGVAVSLLVSGREPTSPSP